MGAIDTGISKKYKTSYVLILFICLTMNFLGTVIGKSGAISFAVFLFTGFLIFAVTKSFYDFVFISVAVLINSALAEGDLGPLSVKRVIFLATLCMLFYLKMTSSKKKKLIVPGWFYFLWLGYLFVNNVLIHRQSALSMLSVALLFLISYTLQILVADSRKKAEKFVIVFIIGFVFIVLVSYVELLFGRTFFYSQWTGAERYRNGILRTGSTVLDPNNICFMIVPFLFLLETEIVKAVVSKKMRRIIEVLCVGTVLLSSSRAGYVALLIGVVFYIIARKKSYLLLSIPFIAVASNYALSSLENILGMYRESTSYRNHIVEIALSSWSKNKMFGAGSGIIGALFGDVVNTMNTYVFMLCCYGIVGLGLYILFIIILLQKDIAGWLKKKVPEKDTVLKICSVLSMLILAYTLDTFYLMLMWVYPAFFLAIGYYQTKAEEQK